MASTISKIQAQQLAEERLAAARALLTSPAPCWSSAYYLAGYTVELALKACIAGQFRSDEIPDKKLVNDIYTHDLKVLLNRSVPARPQIEGGREALSGSLGQLGDGQRLARN